MAAQSALLSHRFPGNVRELENLLHRAVALSTHHILEPEDLGLSTPAPSLDNIEIELPAPINLASSTAGQPLPLPSDLAAHLDQIERDILVQALEKHRLNRTAAGASLGLSLRQMRYRMARLGVQVTDQGIVLGERFDPDADTDQN